MFLMSHPLGNANARQTALALNEAGLLAELWTCLHWVPGSPAERWMPVTLAHEFGRRGWPEAVRPHVRTVPMREAARLLASRLPGARWLTRHEAGWCSVDAVFRGLDRAVARRVPELSHGPEGISGVYAYEDGAAATFQAARQEGLRCVYDLPIGYWTASEEIFAEEAEREPAWAATLTGMFDSAAKRERKTSELEMADAIIVASSFTRQTLATLPALRAPIHVIPYGAPTPPEAADRRADHGGGGTRPLRVLFAGSLGQRKGLSYLLDAVERLKGHVELTLLGAKTVHGCAPLDAAVRTHRWIPSLPHDTVLAEMSRQDVLVLPSLFEGFGLVILEGMSRGLPVIATTHTGGPDVIDDGVDGFIVPVRSAEAIAEKLELLHRDPARLASMQEAARRKAAALTWETYRRRLAAAVSATPALAPTC